MGSDRQFEKKPFSVPPAAILPMRSFAPPFHEAEQNSYQNSYQENSSESSQYSSQPLTQPLQRKLSIGAPGDKYEQEADQMAAKVVNKLQRQPQEEEEELQMKSESIQPPEEEEELQMKATKEAIGGGAASADLETSIQSQRGGGKAIDESVRKPIEQAFGADFSGVKIHTDSQADVLNRSLHSRAFTTGQDVFFKQGEYNPQSRAGQELLAHELTHVVQQTGSHVQAKSQAKSLVRRSPQPQANVIQRYVVKPIAELGGNYRVSDDGKMVVQDSSAGSGAKEFYAHPSVISASNSQLTSINSGFRLVQKSETIEVKIPHQIIHNKTQTLHRAIPKNVVDNSEGNAMETYEDCGTQAGMVMGFNTYDDVGMNSAMVQGLDNAQEVGKERGVKYANGQNFLPHSQANKMGGKVSEFVVDAQVETRKRLTGSNTDARALYEKMSLKDIQKASKQLGVNQFAKADVGESYVIKRTGDRDKTKSNKWDYHWGGVVATSGEDRVTLENHGRSQTAKDMDSQEWYIRMYGPLKQSLFSKDDQTYHGENQRSGDYGDTPLTLRVGKF
jgi:hypothetical protein